MNWSLKTGFRNVALLAIGSALLQAAAPEGWFMAGSRPTEYDCNKDPSATYQGLPSTYLKSKDGLTTTGFGTLMQQFNAANYLGKRIQFSANVKAEGVTNWSGLWMRVDHGNESVAFDNMQQRPIAGTRGWQRYSVVLDVPQEATGIFLGILLHGPGAVWMNGGKFEVVGADVPTTTMKEQAQAVVTQTGVGVYHVVLPATARWGASIPNPSGQAVTIANLAGHVCWDPSPIVREGCNGPEGSGRIPSKEMGQPEDFLAPDKAAGSLVTKFEGGMTYFSINDRATAFDDNIGHLEFDANLANPSHK